MDFHQIIGNDKAIEALKKSIKNKTISHSYLFQGNEGIGKKKIAYAFSKALLCKEEESEPCNKCTSCNKFNSGNNPDFFLIEPEKDLINVKKIEGLIDEMATIPFESKRKVFIINDAHKMNQASQNKLLKTLEEPPAFAHMILISSSPSSLLSTILSRVQRIKFYPIKTHKIIDLLVKEYNKTEEEARLIGELTRGSIKKAIELSKDDAFWGKREEVIKIIDSLIKGNRTRVFSSISFFDENKEIIDEILDVFLFWFRDLIIYKELGQSNLLINKDKLECLGSQSHMDFCKINDIIENVLKTKENIKKNINYQLAIETMLLSI